MVVSECFPSSFQINQQALLWNNEDSQNRREREAALEHRLKGCFVVPSQHSSSRFSLDATCAGHLFQKSSSWLWSCQMRTLSHLNTPFPILFFSLLLLLAATASPLLQQLRKGHSLPLFSAKAQSLPWVTPPVSTWYKLPYGRIN